MDHNMDHNMDLNYRRKIPHWCPDFKNPISNEKPISHLSIDNYTFCDKRNFCNSDSIHFSSTGNF